MFSWEIGMYTFLYWGAVNPTKMVSEVFWPHDNLRWTLII